MQDSIYPRQPYRSTHIVTSVANLAGLRPRMLRAAFKAGIADRNTGENLAKGAEWGSVGTLVGASAVLAERIAGEGIKGSMLLAAGTTLGGLGAIGLAAKTFGQLTQRQAYQGQGFVTKDTLSAINDVLEQKQVWDELDAYLLGRCIESMTSYVKRNSGRMLNQPSYELAKRNLQTTASVESDSVRARVQSLLEEKSAQALMTNFDMQMSMTETWDTTVRTVEFAISEGMMHRTDPTIAALAFPAWRNLRLLGLRQPKQQPKPVAA